MQKSCDVIKKHFSFVKILPTWFAIIYLSPHSIHRMCIVNPPKEVVVHTIEVCEYIGIDLCAEPPKIMQTCLSREMLVLI